MLSLYYSLAIAALSHWLPAAHRPVDATLANANLPFVIINEVDKSSPLMYNSIVPGSKAPDAFTAAEVRLDQKALGPEAYAAISSATLSLQVSPGMDQAWSVPEKGVLELPLERFDREKGILYFKMPKTTFSMRWPELAYTVQATVKLTLTYAASATTNRAGSSKGRTELMEQTIPNWPLNLRRNGKPFRVDITRVKDGARFSFVMYANSEKNVSVLCGTTNHFRTGQATLAITPLQAHPKDLVEINPVFNADNGTLISIESASHVIGVVPPADEPWVFDPAWAADGKGTRRTASAAQSKPALL